MSEFSGENARVDADTVAHRIVGAVESTSPKASDAVGRRTRVFLKRLLPARAVEQGIAREHGLEAMNRQTIRYNALAALW